MYSYFLFQGVKYSTGNFDCDKIEYAKFAGTLISLEQILQMKPF